MKKFFAKLIGLLTAFLLGFGIISALKPQNESAKATTEQKNMEKAIDIYLIAGQSNAVGSSLIDGGVGYPTSNNKANAETFDNVWYSGRAHYWSDGRGAYEIPLSAKKSVTLGHGFTTNHMGPEYGMAKILNDKYANSDRDCAIIKSAAGGTKLLGSHTNTQDNLYNPDVSDTNHDRYGSWYPESLWKVEVGGKEVNLWDSEYYHYKTGLQYRAFVDWVDAEVKYLKSQGYTDINFKALCWMQGEADRDLVDAYRRTFASFCTDIRRNLSEKTEIDCAKMPIVVGEISDTFGSYESMDTNVAFNKMLNEIQTEILNVYTINSGDFWITDKNDVVYGSDAYHWSYADMVEIGKLFGKTAYESVYNSYRLYLEKRSDASGVQYSSPNGTFEPSAFILDGKESITLSFKTDIKYKVKEFGYVENGNRVPFEDEYEYEVTGDERSYQFEVDVPKDQDLKMYVTYANATKIQATCSVKNGDTTYGNNISKSSMQNDGYAYEDAGFYFNVLPKANGRLKSAWINGIEIQDVNGLSKIEIDDVREYLTNGKSSLEIVVEYEECDVLSIENAKLTYIEGENFTTEGATVILTYTDGRTEVLQPSDYEVDLSNFKNYLPGTYEVKIKKRGASTVTLNVEVIISPLFVQGIEPVYLIGNGYDASQVVVQYQNRDGEKVSIPASEYTIETNFNKDVVGEYNFKIKPDGKYPYPACEFTVKVVEPITIEISNQTTAFNLGDEFVLGDMVVMATGNSGTKTLMPGEYTVNYDAYDKTTVGEYEIVVSADGADDVMYTVAVVEPTLTLSGMKTVYNIGESFSKKNLVVNYTDKFGTIKLNQNEYVINSSAFNKDLAGEYAITVTVKDGVYITDDLQTAVIVSKTYTVTVVGATVDPTLTISGQKTQFSKGENFAIGNLIVKYTDESGERTLSLSEYTVDSSAYNKDVVGSYTISISANDLTTTYQVTVIDNGENGSENNGGGGCSGKAGDILLLVSTLCAIAFVGRKAGRV